MDALRQLLPLPQNAAERAAATREILLAQPTIARKRLELAFLLQARCHARDARGARTARHACNARNPM